jgi:sigma-B regulation protein RsbU (phosphoserine phosphatase)
MLVIEDPRSRPLLRRQFPARADCLAAIRRALNEALATLPCPPAIASDIVLAVNEACQNVIRHAYRDRPGDLILELRRVAEGVELRLIDFAPPTNPAVLIPRDLAELRPGGFGVPFIRTLLDRVEFLAPPAGAGNLLCMQKRLGEP